MVTGASTANAAIILIDARNGVTEQTFRHSYISSLLQIPHIIICVNKMDLVDYKEEKFTEIKNNFEAFASKLSVKDIQFIPISALKGDNVVKKSQNMPWYFGGTLLYILENMHIGSDYDFENARFPVQYVIRPQSEEYHDYRGYAGRIAGGIFHKGDLIKILPSGFTSTIKSIDTYNGELEEAFPPLSVALSLDGDFDISRGDMIVKANNGPKQGQDIDIMMCWMNEKPLQLRKKYILKHTSNEVRCMVKEIKYKVNVNTLDKISEDKNIKLNDIACVSLRTTKPLFFDSYSKNRITGSLILIDEATNETLGVGMIK